ncbi:hypothetical protein LTR17_015205 [Elasticomyces elasticus]|nr:hypothetical protein LTR17_015205 [Elasticomyces elasticus]
MSKTLRAGLAWGTPVKPDQLINSLAAYKTALPILKTLRLVHRFGTGPQVHITKLPVEMLLLIEDFVIATRRKAQDLNAWPPYDIESDFACFESKCEPRHHWVEEEDLWDDAGPITQCDPCEKEATEGTFSHVNCALRCTKDTATPCGTCSDDGMGAEDCERNCYAKWKDSVNEVAQETDHNWEVHQQQKNAWLSRIAKGEKGAFQAYKTILKQHFGLEVYLANTVMDGNHEEERWPKHKNHRWHRGSERQTTLCYITIPKRLGPKGVFDADDDMSEEPIDVAAAQAVQVNTSSLSITEEQRRRLRRALKTLGLEVYLHPSQAHAYTATPNLEEDSDEESSSDGTKGISSYIPTPDVPC